MTAMNGRRGIWTGIGIGVAFCALTVFNAVVIGAQAQSLFAGAAGQANVKAQLIVYVAATLAVMLHLFIWFAYAGAVGIVSRFLFVSRQHVVPFITLFGRAGSAQLPLVVWALFVAVTWLVWKPTTSAQFLTLSLLNVRTRYIAYVCALVSMTVLVAAEYRSSRRKAIVAAWSPAVVLMLALAVVNAVAAAAAGH
jgi:hypothetical protein